MTPGQRGGELSICFLNSNSQCLPRPGGNLNAACREFRGSEFRETSIGDRQLRFHSDSDERTGGSRNSAHNYDAIRIDQPNIGILKLHDSIRDFLSKTGCDFGLCKDPFFYDAGSS